MSATLPPPAALAHAARLLAAEGFREVARNTRGDALYLRRADCPWHLRLSNHARTPKQRRRRTDILTSLVIDAPRSVDQVAALVEGALRNFRAALALRSADETGRVPLSPPGGERPAGTPSCLREAQAKPERG